MEILIILLAVIAFALFAFFIHSYYLSRGNDIIHQWARNNSHAVKDIHYCMFNRGPFMFKSHKNHSVFKVILSDNNTNEIKEAFFRCGSFWKGIHSDEVAIEWVSNKSLQRKF